MEAKRIKGAYEIASGTLLPDDDDNVAYFKYIGPDNEPRKRFAARGDTVAIWQSEITGNYWVDHDDVECYFSETWGYINNYLFEIGELYETEYGTHVYAGVIVDIEAVGADVAYAGFPSIVESGVSLAVALEVAACVG